MGDENRYNANGNNFGGGNWGQPPVRGQSQPQDQMGYGSAAEPIRRTWPGRVCVSAK